MDTATHLADGFTICADCEMEVRTRGLTNHQKGLRCVARAHAQARQRLGLVAVTGVRTNDKLTQIIAASHPCYIDYSGEYREGNRRGPASAPCAYWVRPDDVWLFDLWRTIAKVLQGEHRYTFLAWVLSTPEALEALKAVLLLGAPLTASVAVKITRAYGVGDLLGRKREKTLQVD